MNDYNALEEVEKIIKLPEPEFLWNDPKNDEYKFYGYRSSEMCDEKVPLCFGIWLKDIKKMGDVKSDAKLDIARVLLFGMTKDNKEIDKDYIKFPKIEMTESQFKKIRKIGREIIKKSN